MTRNLKALGLALIAVFAMSALGAGSASAAEFHAEGTGPFTIDGEDIGADHVFTSNAGNVTCEIAKFTGTQSTNTAKELTIKPNYEKCHIIIFGSTVSAEVKMNSCDYHFTITGATVEDVTAGDVTITCTTAGDTIQVIAAGGACTVKIGAQGPLGKVTYTNTTTAKPVKDVDVDAAVTGIGYSFSGFACGSGSGTNGTYTGTTTVQATDKNGNLVDSWVT